MLFFYFTFMLTRIAYTHPYILYDVFLYKCMHINIYIYIFSSLFSLCVALFVLSGMHYARLTWKSVCICFLCCVFMYVPVYVFERIFWAFGMFNVKVVALGRMRIWVRQTEIMCYIFVGTYSMLRNGNFDVRACLDAVCVDIIGTRQTSTTR